MTNLKFWQVALEGGQRLGGQQAEDLDDDVVRQEGHVLLRLQEQLDLEAHLQEPVGDEPAQRTGHPLRGPHTFLLLPLSKDHLLGRLLLLLDSPLLLLFVTEAPQRGCPGGAQRSAVAPSAGRRTASQGAAPRVVQRGSHFPLSLPPPPAPPPLSPAVRRVRPPTPSTQIPPHTCPLTLPRPSRPGPKAGLHNGTRPHDCPRLWGLAGEVWKRSWPPQPAAPGKHSSAGCCCARQATAPLPLCLPLQALRLQLGHHVQDAHTLALLLATLPRLWSYQRVLQGRRRPRLGYSDQSQAAWVEQFGAVHLLLVSPLLQVGHHLHHRERLYSFLSFPAERLCIFSLLLGARPSLRELPAGLRLFSGSEERFLRLAMDPSTSQHPFGLHGNCPRAGGNLDSSVFPSSRGAGPPALLASKDGDLLLGVAGLDDSPDVQLSVPAVPLVQGQRALLLWGG